MELFFAEDQGPLALDRGLAYGDGLFETIRINGDRPVMADAHIDRLCKSATRLGFNLHRHSLTEALEQACQHYCRDQAGGWVLKMLATRGVGGRGYVPPGSPSPHLLFSQHVLPSMPDPRGVNASLWPHPLVIDPLLAGMKTLNRLPQVLASRSIEAGCYEILMADGNGHFLEGSRTNVIALVGDCWLTPPASSLAVSGIARQAALRHLQDNGETIRKVAIDPSLIEKPDFGGLLLVNSVIGAVPVRRIEGRELPISDQLATIQSFLLDAVGI